jgi:2'-5' RNA ligase
MIAAMRAFIAIEIPAEVKAQLGICSRELANLPVEAGWTKSAGIHLTLKFLGEIPESSQAAIAAAMQHAAARTAPFRLELQGLGAFPNLNRPRVLWAGLAGEVAAAQRLQQDLEQFLEAAGFPREGKAFKPHLTLARIKNLPDPRRFATAVAACRVPPASFEVGRIVLYRSELHPAGARYTELAEAPLDPRL